MCFSGCMCLLRFTWLLPLSGLAVVSASSFVVGVRVVRLLSVCFWVLSSISVLCCCMVDIMRCSMYARRAFSLRSCVVCARCVVVVCLSKCSLCSAMYCASSLYDLIVVVFVCVVSRCRLVCVCGIV